MLSLVIVPAMEDSEASGFRFAPLSGDRCWHSGERRPEAFVRLVFFDGCACSDAVSGRTEAKPRERTRFPY